MGKRMIPTTKTEAELVKEIDALRVDGSGAVGNRLDPRIRFVGRDMVCVSCGMKINTRWRYNIDDNGVITIGRYMTCMEWVEMVSIGIIDILLAIVFLYGRFTLNAVLVLFGFIAGEVLLIYFLYVFYPWKILDRFIRKNL